MSTTPSITTPTQAIELEAVTGVQLMQGVGLAPAKEFWADAWSQVMKRWTAVVALCWLTFIGTIGVLAPLLASGYPLRITEPDHRTALHAGQSMRQWIGERESVERKDLVRYLQTELSHHSPPASASDFLKDLPSDVVVPRADVFRLAERLEQSRALDQVGGLVATSPILHHLKSSDVALLLLVPLGVIFIALPLRHSRSSRLVLAVAGGVVAGLVVVGSSFTEGYIGGNDAPTWAKRLWGMNQAGLIVSAIFAIPIATSAALLPGRRGLAWRAPVCAVCALCGVFAVSVTWNRPLSVFDYIPRERNLEINATYTLVPFSPSQRFPELDRKPPMSTLGQGMGMKPDEPGANRTFILGTDALGVDVLSSLMHACRLAISIGLVSTGIAVTIGVTIGALMGYFGGWVDLALFRVVEVFMAVPLLFLLIVASAVLPPELRTTYTMMAIIGCFTWTGAARFTRAEFLKLRNQDFVQSARAVGLPLRSILFRHMLPNGVTPVLVDASFAVAAAITIEATLSFLGLGPVDQASWGKLLASAVNVEGQFKWWLAVFPGAAIFLTVLSYNLIGEALRDAIDPKLKKARV